MATSAKKRRAAVSYENLSAEVRVAFDEKYPKGLQDCLADLNKYDLPNGKSFYAVTFETDDAVYLVKFTVKIDDADDLQKWLEGEESNDEVATDNQPDDTGSEIPSDNLDQITQAEDTDEG